MTSQLKKVLLVDDEPKLISALRRRLSLEFNVVTANGGPEALQIIDNDKDIAVIVADMQMPEMNGIELLKAVKQRAPSIRRLMLTGNSDQETAIAAVNEGGVMRFLRKPCDNDDLKAALRHALEDHAFQNAAQTATQSIESVSDRAEDARNAFLSMMNHELRTPLNHIIGLAQVLEGSEIKSDDAESNEFLKNIRGSGEQMLQIVDRILEFSRLTSEQPSNTSDTADIIGIVNSEVAKIRREARMKGVTISVDSLRLKANVLANEREARLGIRELLSNAVKFNTEDGHVSILIKCDLQQTAIRISDTGVGASKELLAQLTQPFRQADSSYSRAHDGLGLGLALVSTIARANGAAFTIEPGAAGGVTATLVFQRPIADASQAVA